MPYGQPDRFYDFPYSGQLNIRRPDFPSYSGPGPPKVTIFLQPSLQPLCPTSANLENYC